MEIKPSYDGIDPSELTREDFDIITQNEKQTTSRDDWLKQDRYAAQPVLDYLYLGPTSAIRNHDSLREQGITMLMVVRDSRMPTSSHNADQASRELGLPVEYVRVQGGDISDLVQSLPGIIGLVNRHMLSVYHDAQQSTTDRRPGGEEGGAGGGGGGGGEEEEEGHGPAAVEAHSQQRRRGKVLITCDSGLYYSPTIIAAYLMSMYGQTLISAVDFVDKQRCGCIFDQKAKLTLRSWQMLVRPRPMTEQRHLQWVKQRQEQDKQDTPEVRRQVVAKEESPSFDYAVSETLRKRANTRKPNVGVYRT
ncbi:hypothetical protein E4U54_001122 [Claviceps lovelessii]|nr:hypothetical protein E4U54_001122 [Claviceps lovelessii]